MSLFLILPIAVPLLTAVAALLVRHPSWQLGISLAGATALLGGSAGLAALIWQEGIQVAQVGNWPAPFGITLVADLLSAVMVGMAGVMGLSVVVYSMATIDDRRRAFGFHPLLHVMLVGVCGAFLTGDLFNLYVWFEVMLIASFALLVLGGEKRQLEGAIKYVALNLVSSALFLTAVGIAYGFAGTLNMADLARQLGNTAQPGLVTTLSLLLLVAFGIKGALFPLFFWLPASYHTPPVAVTAIFSGLLTKVGVYSLLRAFTLLFPLESGGAQPLLLAIAGLTMVTGVLGAVAQSEMRRLLSFHIVSQIGYLLMGLALNSLLALAGAVFFMVHVILAKSALFLVTGICQRVGGTSDLKPAGGLYRRHPGVAALFLIPALALAGIPPLSGFWAKYALVRAGLELGQYAIVATALAVSVLTLFSMTKIWTEAFWKAPPVTGTQSRPAPETPLSMLLPAAALGALTIAMGIGAEPFFAVALRAAEQLLDPAQYVRAVLGG
jgi:multicomponent Na+:H+ antiporter subunit D